MGIKKYYSIYKLELKHRPKENKTSFLPGVWEARWSWKHHILLIGQQENVYRPIETWQIEWLGILLNTSWKISFVFNYAIVVFLLILLWKKSELNRSRFLPSLTFRISLMPGRKGRLKTKNQNRVKMVRKNRLERRRKIWPEQLRFLKWKTGLLIVDTVGSGEDPGFVN